MSEIALLTTVAWLRRHALLSVKISRFAKAVKIAAEYAPD
jgi:hypothetical protein